jgi:N-acetylglutamate synthase-like GNAT family acetyltransferase
MSNPFVLGGTVVYCAIPANANERDVNTLMLLLKFASKYFMNVGFEKLISWFD